MENKKQKFFEECIEPVLTYYGIDSSTVTYYPENTRKLEDICYLCVCGKDVAKRYKAMKTNPLCSVCSGKPVKRGPKSQDISKFEELALAKGYMVTPKKGEVYVNTKSRITVTNIETGETHPSSYASFRAGHIHSHHHASLQKVLSVNEVKKRVKKAGFIWIEGTIYVDAKTPIKVLCHCGDEYTVAVSNLHEDRVGCEKCYRYKRDNPWITIENVANERGCKILTQEKEYKGRDTTLFFTCYCAKAYHKTAKNFIKAPWCDNCADKYRKETNLERHGVENALISKQAIQNREKRWMDNHGVRGNMGVKEIRERAEATCMKNRGVKRVIGTEENEKRRFEVLMEKYGSNTTLHSPQYKNTMMTKYNCEHSMQNPDSFMKMLKTSLKLKQYTFPSGRIEYVQGYEPICLDYLLVKEGIDEDDIVVTPSKVPEMLYEFEGRTCKYYVDIYIKSQDRAIEVKSHFTYRSDRAMNDAKWETASTKYTRFDVYVFDLKWGALTRLQLSDSEPDYMSDVYLQMEMWQDKTAEVHEIVFSNATFLSYLAAIMYVAFTNEGFVICEISDKAQPGHYTCSLTFQKGVVTGDEKELTMVSNYTHNLFDSTDFEKPFDNDFPLKQCKKSYNVHKKSFSVNEFINTGITLLLMGDACKITR